MAGKKKRKFRSLPYYVNRLFDLFERMGWVARTPAFVTDYYQDYPTLQYLDEAYEDIRQECLELIKSKNQLKDMESLVRGYTKGGIHSIKWKSFMLKSGRYIKVNCEKCPKTFGLLQQVKGVRTAFFSILDANQYIKPHVGYYKGFMRYHLGVLIPNNNEDKTCWIRVNDQRVEFGRKRRWVKQIESGQKYYWRNGEGILFNDTYLHDAANQSDQVRIVLFIDVERKFPLFIHWFNQFLLWIAYQSPKVKQVAKDAEVQFADETP